jgi:putative transposase
MAIAASRAVSTAASSRRLPRPSAGVTGGRRSAYSEERKIVNQYQKIAVGDVSSLQLAKTRMAKSVLDSGWGLLRAFLQSKGQQAARSIVIVSEKDTSRICSSCGAVSGPRGVNELRVRRWRCAPCGAWHDRDANAAKNILRRAELPASVSGNELSILRVPPSRAPRSRKAGIDIARSMA